MSLPKEYKEIELASLCAAVKSAGEEILRIYATDFDVEIKGDDSPLTAADKAANKVLMDYVTEHTPNIPVISEENKEVHYNDRKDWNQFWLIDPLDGTKEFIKKNGEFTVNSYKVASSGEVTVIKNEIHYSKRDHVIVVASRSHLSEEVVTFTEDLKSQGKEVDFISAGSSLKFCLVAEGQAHVYPRLGPTMEWDTGAAHAVALGAGLNVLRADNKEPLQYNKENLLNPYFMVE